MPAGQQKKDTPPGGRWTQLETPGDVRRFLRWLILQTKADKVEVRKAGVLGQLALYLLKSLEVSDLSDRMAKIEAALEATEEHGDTSSTHTTH